MNNKPTFSDACDHAEDALRRYEYDRQVMNEAETIQIVDHRNCVIIPKEQYNAMKQALEKFADKTNWLVKSKYDEIEWIGDSDKPWEIARKSLETTR